VVVINTICVTFDFSLEQAMKVQRYSSTLSLTSALDWVVGVGRDSSVGIAATYGQEGPGIEYRRGRGFPHPSRPALGPPIFLYNAYRVIPGGKAAGSWR
jgi:hypothetical protein